MVPSPPYPRFAVDQVIEALADAPVVLLHGPRQCGKTTLARGLADARGDGYLTFDDAVVAEAARVDPIGFVAGLPPRVVLDEIQRAPGLLTTIKASVDRDRSPGRFLLAGSTNVLLLPHLGDSLAGRMAIVRLHPLAQAELRARQPPGFLDDLFGGAFRVGRGPRLGGELAARVVAGGYPAALARATPRRRAAWYRDYVETLVQRDVRDLARIRALDAIPRLLQLAAAQTAQLANVAELAAPFQVSRPTIIDYLALLERVFLVERIPPWHDNRISRLVKTPKLHLGDTGLAAALLGLDAAALRDDRAAYGRLVETFAYQELRRLASWHDAAVAFHHLRDKDGVEVDLVLERGRRVAGVEIKAGATVTAADFRGLRKLAAALGSRFAGGAVLYDGEAVASFGERLHAVPLRALWETPA